MRIVFADESTIGVERINKTYDISGSEVRMSVEITNDVDIDEVLDKDFSVFTLKRNGFADVEFEGFTVNDVSEFFESRTTNVSVNLVKEMASA